jgi:hypothetical protein
MTNTITTNKRGRNSSVILTDRMCERRVAKRIKIYDRKCPGLYVSITSGGVATFSFKFTDPETGKQRTGWIGVYIFQVQHARSRVYGLKAKGGKVVAETLRQHKAQQVKQGKTVDKVIDERVEWMKTPVLKRDGEMRSRIETWRNVESHLHRFISPRLGKKIASEVTNGDIAQLWTTSWPASSASRQRPTPATCAARLRQCSHGRPVRAGVMSRRRPASNWINLTRNIPASACLPPMR